MITADMIPTSQINIIIFDHIIREVDCQKSIGG